MKQLLTKKDLLLILCALLAAGALLALRCGRGTGAVAVVYIGSEEYARLPLNEPRRLIVEQENGCRNVIEVADGRVFMAESNCKNHDCMEQGALGGAGERALGNWIICLPNRVSIELEEGE